MAYWSSKHQHQAFRKAEEWLQDPINSDLVAQFLFETHSSPYTRETWKLLYEEWKDAGRVEISAYSGSSPFRLSHEVRVKAIQAVLQEYNQCARRLQGEILATVYGCYTADNWFAYIGKIFKSNDAILAHDLSSGPRSNQTSSDASHTAIYPPDERSGLARFKTEFSTDDEDDYYVMLEPGPSRSFRAGSGSTSFAGSSTIPTTPSPNMTLPVRQSLPGVHLDKTTVKREIMQRGFLVRDQNMDEIRFAQSLMRKHPGTNEAFWLEALAEWLEEEGDEKRSKT